MKAFIFCPEAPATPALPVFQDHHITVHTYDDARVDLSRN